MLPAAPYGMDIEIAVQLQIHSRPKSCGAVSTDYGENTKATRIAFHGFPSLQSMRARCTLGTLGLRKTTRHSIS